MKKSILLFAAIAFLASATPPKSFTLTEEQGTQLFQAIEVAKKAIPTSEVPAKEASVALQIFANTQQIIGKQYQDQVKADSTAKKKK